MIISRQKLGINLIDIAFIVGACVAYSLSIDYVGSMLTLASFRGDASYYYVKIIKDEWMDIYPWEPLLWVICLPYGDIDFTEYLIVSNLPPFALSLLGAKMLGVSGVRLVAVAVLLSFSYFGLHLLFNFQRQFISLALLLFGMALSGRMRIIPLFASPMGHLWSVVPALLILVEPFLKKKLVKVVISVTMVVALAVLSAAGASEFSSKAVTYSAYGDEDPLRLIVRSAIQFGFMATLILIGGGFGSLEKRLKKQLIAYLAIMFLSGAIPMLSALFVRFDYYFYPILIIQLFVHFGKPEVSIYRSIMASIFVLAYSIASGVQWVNSISPWIFYGIM